MKQFAFLFLGILFFSIPVSPHGLLFVPGAKTPSDNPHEFLRLIKEAQVEYSDKNRFDPRTWEDLWPYIRKRITGSLVLPESSCKREGRIMTVSAVIEKKKIPYKYIIHIDKGWKVYTENKHGHDNWIIRGDFPHPYRYFDNASAEKKRIAADARKIRTIKVLGLDVNVKRSRILGSWLFYHTDGFDALLPFIEDRKSTCYNRMQAVKALMEMPDLYRFKDRIGRIETLIGSERKIKDEDSYRASFIETLQQLKAMILKNR